LSVIDQSQKVARDYKAQCTPDVYLLDKNKQLYYHGRINDNWQYPDQVKKNSLEDAIAGMLNDQPAPEEPHPSMGCSIKWK